MYAKIDLQDNPGYLSRKLSLESKKYDLTKDYIYISVDELDLSLINTTYEELILKNNNLLVYDGEELIKSYAVISILLNNPNHKISYNLLWIGLDNPNLITLDVINGEYKLGDNIVEIYFKNEVVETIEVVSVYSDYYDLSKGYINVGTKELDVSKINVVNGKASYSKNDACVNIARDIDGTRGVLFIAYPIVKYTSDYYDSNKDYIYLGTYSQDIVSSKFNLINATSTIEDNKFNIYYGDDLLKSYDLVSIVSDAKIFDNNGFLYIKPTNYVPTIEVTNASYNFVNDVMDIYYKGDLINTLEIVKISSDYYDLTGSRILLIEEEFDISKIKVSNAEVRFENNMLLVLCERGSVDSISVTRVSSDYYDLTKDYIYDNKGFDITKINVEGGSLKKDSYRPLIVYSTSGHDLKEYDIVTINSSKYDLSKDYIFVRNDNFYISDIEVDYGKVLLEDNKINIYYEDNLLDSFDLVKMASDMYNLDGKSIYSGPYEFDSNSITLTNGDLVVDGDILKIYYEDECLESYYITKIYSDKYNLTKKYIYTGIDKIDVSRIGVTNGSIVEEYDKILIYNNENEKVASFDIITLSSDRVDVSKDYIYLGTDSIDYGYNIYTISPTIKKIENNELNIYYENDLIKSFDLIQISSSKYNLYRKFIYLGVDKLDLTDITLINGIQKIEDNKLNIYYNDILVSTYELIYISSTKYDLTKKYIFVGTNDFEFSNINIINGELDYVDNNIFVCYDDWLLEKIPIIRISSLKYDIKNDRIHIGNNDADTENISITNGNIIEENGYFKIKLDGKVIKEYLIEANILGISSPCVYYEFHLDEPTTLKVPIEFIPSKYYLQDRTITWSSSDEKVAIVDSNGVVTPVGVGNVRIIATSSNGKTTYSEFNVYGGKINYVSKDFFGAYTGKENTIELSTTVKNAEILYSLDGNNYNIQNVLKFREPGEYTIYYKITADGYEPTYGSNKVSIYGITNIDETLTIKKDLMIINYFKPLFNDIKLKIKIFSEIVYNLIHYDNKMNITENETVKTGDFLKINIGNTFNPIYEYKLTVLGDVNGDGDISPLDYVKIKNHIMGSNFIEQDAYLTAADVNNDEQISPLDYVRVKNHIMSGGNL